MAKTLTLKKLTKEIKAKVGAGFSSPIIEKTIEQTFKEIVKALLEGKSVKIGVLRLKPEIVETSTVKTVRNPQTGEKMEKTINPYVRIKVLPRRLEFSDFEELKKELIASISVR
jgi:nucleoid DNA-binding protein